MRWALWFGLAVLWLGGWARAGKVEVLQADRLELRKVDGHELIVLVGAPVILMLDQDEEVRADRVEYDREARRLLLLGNVYYKDREGRVTEAEELELYLDDETLEAIEVHIQSEGIDLWGPEATRVLGQILLEQGTFTPCARCGQDPYDYCFKARKVVLYPGDRLIAYGVTVFTGGEPLFYWPVLLLHFSERRPRVEFGNDATDGWYVFADLPYVTRNGLGYTLVRYYQNRGWGLGVDHWGVGAAYEHYRALYLPPEVGAARGRLELGLDYRLGDKNLREQPFYQSLSAGWRTPEAEDEPAPWSLSGVYGLKADDWRHDLSLKRDEGSASGRVTFKLNSRMIAGDEPRVGLRVNTYLDLLEPGAPAPRTVPELTLRWTRGYSAAGFSVKGGVVVGGYYDRTNELNRSARAQGVWATAGSVRVDHVDTYRPRAYWPGFSLAAENRFKGYYYDTGERQVDWKSRVRLGQRLGGFRLRAELARQVTEGEAFFARDYLRPVHKLDLDGSLDWTVARGVKLSLASGRDLQNGVTRPLTAALDAQLKPWGLRLDHRYDPELGLHESTTGRIQFRAGDLSLSARSGYRYQEGRYDDLALNASYALPGGNLTLAHTRDLNEARPLKTQAALDLRPGEMRYVAQETYLHDEARLQGRFSVGYGPFSTSLNHVSYLGGDPADPNYRDHELTLSAAWREHRLSLIERWDGAEGRFGPGSLRFDSRYTGLRSLWQARVLWHLPEAGDEEVYVQEATLQAGFDVLRGGAGWPALSLQGRFAYRRYAEDDRSYSFEDFGVTLGWRGEERTRFYLSALLTQEVRTSEGWPPLEPRFVATLDRCCWALRFTLDAAAPSAKLAFVYGDQSARFLFDESGIRFPWEDP